MNLKIIKDSLISLKESNSNIRENAENNLFKLYNDVNYPKYLTELYNQEEDLNLKTLILSTLKSFIIEVFKKRTEKITNIEIKNENYKNNLILILCNYLKIENELKLRKYINYILGEILKISFPVFVKNFIDYIQNVFKMVSNNRELILNKEIIIHFKSISSILKILSKNKYSNQLDDFRIFINGIILFLKEFYINLSNYNLNDNYYLKCNKIFDKLYLSIWILNSPDKNYEELNQKFIKLIFEKFIKLLNLYLNNNDNFLEKYLIVLIKNFCNLLDNSSLIFYSILDEFVKFWIQFLINDLINDNLKSYGFYIFYKITNNYYFNTDPSFILKSLKNDKKQYFYFLQENCYNIYINIFNSNDILKILLEKLILFISNNKTDYINYEDLLVYINHTDMKDNYLINSEMIFFNKYKWTIKIIENLFKNFNLIIELYYDLLRNIICGNIKDYNLINSIFSLSIIFPNIKSKINVELKFDIRNILEFQLNIFNSSNDVKFLRNLVYIYFYWISDLDINFNTLMVNNMHNWLNLNDLVLNYEIINCFNYFLLRKINIDISFVIPKIIPIYLDFIENISSYEILIKIGIFITTLFNNFNDKLNLECIEKFKNIDLEKIIKTNSMISTSNFSKIFKSILIFLNRNNLEAQFFYEICIKYIYICFKNFIDFEVLSVIILWSTLLNTIPYKECYNYLYEELYKIFIDFHKLVWNFDDSITIIFFIDLIKEYLFLNLINNNSEYNLNYFMNFLNKLYKNQNFQDNFKEYNSLKFAILNSYSIFLMYLIEKNIYNFNLFLNLNELIFEDLILYKDQNKKNNLFKNKSITILSIFLINDYNSIIDFFLKKNVNLEVFFNIFFQNLEFITCKEALRFSSVAILKIYDNLNLNYILNYLNISIKYIIQDIYNQIKNEHYFINNNNIIELKKKGKFSQRDFDFKIRNNYYNIDIKPLFREKMLKLINLINENNKQFPEIKPDCLKITFNQILNN